MKSMVVKLMRMGLLVAVLFAVSLLAIPRLNQAFTPPVVQKAGSGFAAARSEAFAQGGRPGL